MEHDSIDILSTKEAAGILEVGPDRVRQLERAGVLPCMKTEKGIRIFLRGDVVALKEKRLLKESVDG